MFNFVDRIRYAYYKWKHGEQANQQYIATDELIKALKNRRSVTYISLLLGNNIKLDYREEKSDYSLIHIACKFKNSLDVIKLFVAKGFVLDIKTKYNITLLHAALSQSNGQSTNFDVIKYLIDNGLDPNELSHSFNSPIMLSCVGSNNYKIRKFLLENGAKINKKHDYNILQFAMDCDIDAASFSLLLEHGAPIEEYHSYQKTIWRGLNKIINKDYNNMVNIAKQNGNTFIKKNINKNNQNSKDKNEIDVGIEMKEDNDFEKIDFDEGENPNIMIVKETNNYFLYYEL